MIEVKAGVATVTWNPGHVSRALAEIKKAQKQELRGEARACATLSRAVQYVHELRCKILELPLNLREALLSAATAAGFEVNNVERHLPHLLGWFYKQLGKVETANQASLAKLEAFCKKLIEALPESGIETSFSISVI